LEDLNKIKEKALTSKQMKCIDLLVYKGLTQVEVAEKIKVTETTISLWKRSDLFMLALDEEIEKSKLDRRRSYSMKANKALHKLDSLLDCGDPKTELAAAKEIIRLAGDDPDPKETDITLNLVSNILDEVKKKAENGDGI